MTPPTITRDPSDDLHGAAGRYRRTRARERARGTAISRERLLQRLARGGGATATIDASGSADRVARERSMRGARTATHSSNAAPDAATLDSFGLVGTRLDGKFEVDAVVAEGGFA